MVLGDKHWMSYWNIGYDIICIWPLFSYNPPLLCELVLAAIKIFSSKKFNYMNHTDWGLFDKICQVLRKLKFLVQADFSFKVELSTCMTEIILFIQCESFWSCICTQFLKLQRNAMVGFDFGHVFKK